MMDGSTAVKRKKTKVAAEEKASAPAVSAPVALPAEDFAKAMQLAGMAVVKGATVLARLDLTEYHGHAALMARNLEHQLTVCIGNAKPREAMVLPAMAFKKFFAKDGASGLDVFISRNRPGYLTVELDGVVAQFAESDGAGWAEPSILEMDPLFSVECKTLAHAIGLCAPVMCMEDTRYYLNGICVAPHGEDATALVFYATDGHRLVKHVVEGLTHHLTEEIIIPRQMIGILLRLLAKMEGHAAIDFEVNDARFLMISCEAWHLKGRLVDGSFPDVERVIPADCPPAAEIHMAALKKFLARAAGMEKGGSTGVRLEIDARQDVIRAVWQSAETGSIALRLDGKAARDLSVGFQIGYLRTALRMLRGEYLALNVAAPRDTVGAVLESVCGPAILASAGELKEPSTTLVIMPMRT